MNVKETMTEFLDNFFRQNNAEKIALIKAFIYNTNFDFEKIETIQQFNVTLKQPFKNFLEGFIRNKFCDNDDFVFIFINNRFVRRHFEQLIKKFEGFCCSADKSLTILNHLLNYYKNGEKIIWNYDQKHTFHLPNKIFTIHDEIINFYEAVRNLYFGNPDKYIELIKKYEL